MWKVIELKSSETWFYYLQKHMRNVLIKFLHKKYIYIYIHDKNKTIYNILIKVI